MGVLQMPEHSDGDNLTLADSPQSADSANREFYARFPYPWPPVVFPRLEDPSFETVMLNQSIGDFTHRTIRETARVWVAGCGTNQAVYTALRFPGAWVVGSDLSAASLEIAAANARSLGIRNLILRQESLNEVKYTDEFDYILCTGVIHHNAEPASTLATVARALRKEGVLELMVYNRFHRTLTSAFQKAVRLLSRNSSGGAASYEQELEIARALLSSEPIASRSDVACFGDAHDSFLADSLIQPVERSYTVQSLSQLAAPCGLRLILPCDNQFDQNNDAKWTLRSSSADVKARIGALPDVERWQVANLLLMERSPMLWFFLRRSQIATNDYYEREVNLQYLDGKFARTATRLRNHVRQNYDLQYKQAAVTVSYPKRPCNPVIRDIIDRANGLLTMRQILGELGLDVEDQATVTEIRMHTTTSLSPYLRAV